MIKNTIIKGLILIFIPSFSACTEDKPSGLPMKVVRYYLPGSYWVEIAGQKGWFKEAGLNVELIDTNPDYFASLEATVAGKTDANCFYLFDLMRFVAKGADLVMVVNTDVSISSEGLVAGHEIDSIRKLIVKRIGLTKSTTLEYELSEVLGRNGLTTDDVIIMDMPGEKSAEEFIKGRVDAIITWEPFVTEAVKKGKGRKLFDTSEILGISTMGFVFHRSFIEKRPEDVRAFLRVWSRTTGFIKKNPDEAYRIIAGIYKKSPADVIEFARIDKILNLEDNRINFIHSHGFESLTSTSDRINRYMIKRGVINKELDYNTFLDGSFIRSIKNGGYKK